MEENAPALTPRAATVPLVASKEEEDAGEMPWAARPVGTLTAAVAAVDSIGTIY